MTKKINDLLTKREALIESWKNRNNYKGYDRSKGSSFNSWRAIIYTKKGKKIGFPESWNSFNVFLNDVRGEWSTGKIVCRHDIKKPHSKDNSFWSEKCTEQCGRLIKIEYNGEIKTLLEFAKQFNQNYNGIRQRYFRGKNYTNEEIIFGLRIKNKKTINDINTLNKQQQKDKISKMLSAYKCRDKKRGVVFGLTRDYFENNIINNTCSYCGSKENIGCDRIDNSLGHTNDNVIPSCYVCNTVRNNHFSVQEMKKIGNVIREIYEYRKK